MLSGFNTLFFACADLYTKSQILILINIKSVEHNQGHLYANLI